MKTEQSVRRIDYRGVVSDITDSLATRLAHHVGAQTRDFGGSEIDACVSKLIAEELGSAIECIDLHVSQRTKFVKPRKSTRRAAAAKKPKVKP